jgi:hypothetical protein
MALYRRQKFGDHSSFQLARLNLLRSDTPERSFCIEFKVIWRNCGDLGAVVVAISRLVFIHH